MQQDAAFTLRKIHFSKSFFPEYPGIVQSMLTQLAPSKHSLLLHADIRFTISPMKAMKKAILAI